MDNRASENKSPFNFFLLVLMLSVPFWILGLVAPDTTKLLPIKLPISALMAFCPMLAAIILVYKKSKKQEVKKLLKLPLDFKKINNRKWYVPVIFLMPTIAFVSYLYTKMTGSILPGPSLSLLSICIFFLVYFVGAIGEEVGWSGYVTNPLQNKYGALSKYYCRYYVGRMAYYSILPGTSNNCMDFLAMYCDCFFTHHYGLDI